MRKIINYILLFIDYPFIFYWTLQTKSKDRLSHSGKAFATVVYVLILIIIKDDLHEHFGKCYNLIYIDRILGVFVIYLFPRFYYKDRIVIIAEESKRYPKLLQLFLKGYSILILLYAFLPIILKYMGYWID